MPYYLIEIMTNKQTKQTEKTMKQAILDLINNHVQAMNVCWMDSGFPEDVSNNPIDHGILFSFGSDSFAIDGYLLDESRGWETPSKLWESIEALLWENDYENHGFGLYKKDISEGE